MSIRKNIFSIRIPAGTVYTIFFERGDPIFFDEGTFRERNPDPSFLRPSLKNQSVVFLTKIVIRYITN